MADMAQLRVPAGMPFLRVGRHRRPRSGACVMEYVSLIAGERFNDDPECVDAPLAALARVVNDRLGDDARQRLLTRVVDLIDTATATDEVRLRAAAVVLEAASGYLAESRNDFLVAVAVLALERVAAGEDDVVRRSVHRSLQTLTAAGGRESVGRAREFVETSPYDARRYLTRGLPTALAGVAHGVADVTPGSDDALLHLLDVAIGEYAATATAARVTAADKTWRRDRLPFV